MATLDIPNVPEDLYERLKDRAANRGHSLSAEVITLLAWAVEEAERSPATTLDAIWHRRSFGPSEVDAPDSTALLQDDRQR
jgi:plasmid stability protein